MKHYARFFQNLASKPPQKLNILKTASAGVAFTAYGHCYLETEKRYAQTFFKYYLETTLTPEEKHRYNTEPDYKKSINEEARQAYRVCTRYEI
ncbi:MAG: hypothetical protein P1U36_05310 [Legionellaceae bacterium]|nr:hypothetical protein [Legionellaceae bacterium]